MLLILLGGAWSGTAADSVVVFNEVQYHPAPGGQEWIELHNQMAVDIDLSAWRMNGTVALGFPEGTIIPGGDYLVIAEDPIAWRETFGDRPVLGPFSGRLGNGSGRLELLDRNARLMDRLDYADDGRWPVAPDGSGATLAKREPTLASGLPENWSSSVLIGGTPGRRNFPKSFERRQLTLAPLEGSWRYEASAVWPGASWTAVSFDDRGWAGSSRANLVAYWPLDGNAIAARGVSGTLYGATAAADRQGQTDGAVSFHGAIQSLGRVDGGGGLDGATAGTISLWVNWIGMQDADCCGSFGAVLSRQGDGLFSDNILALDAPDPQSARIVWRQSGGPAPILLTGTSAVGPGWHHVAVTFSPEASVLYVDGLPQRTGRGDPLHQNANVALSLGAWADDGSGYATALLDDVAIWDAVLGADQVALLAASAKTPLDYAASERAVYFAGTGRMTAQDELRHTQLPLGPNTHYFRHTFQFEADPARAALALGFAVDDGAVFYLNGAEFYRHNLPTGLVTPATRAATTVDHAPLVLDWAVEAKSLVRGTNVLAVEVHQATANDPDLVFGAGLTATLTTETNQPQDFLSGDLVFNELAGTNQAFQIELYNRGEATLDLTGYLIRRTGGGWPDAASPLPERSLGPGGFLVLDEDDLGFLAAPKGRVFLLKPGQRAVADAAQIGERLRGRWPDGTGDWWFPVHPTWGARNQVEPATNLVVNEIMYHAPPLRAAPDEPFREDPEQWVELLNRGREPVNLAGWALGGDLRYSFPAGTRVAPGGYLVVANDPTALREQWPDLPVIGPFTGSLSHRRGRLELHDATGNRADGVAYGDDGRWPPAADGGGSSLELRSPVADRTAAEAWAASVESGRTTWRTYSYRGIARASGVGPDGQWHEFVLGLLDAGEVLLDDLSVVESPGGASPVELLQNGTFESGLNSWRIIGNHHGEVVTDPDQPGNRVLRLVATGATEHMSNHAETTFKNNRDLVNGREYAVSFRAKWIRGSRQLHTRLYFNRLARTTWLEAPRHRGTPGAPNSTAAANLGPTFRALRHTPAVPAPATPLTVRVEVEDPDGIASVALWWRPDGAAWRSIPMALDPIAPAAFRATLPGGGAGTIGQFYVEAADARGARSWFPAAGPDSRALWQVDDGLGATNGLHNLRLIALRADADQLHAPINLMSNARIGATVISDEHEIFYDVGLRLKGSEHSRTTTERLGFNVRFNPDQLFRGIHRTVALDRSESTGFGQREMLLNQTLNHAGGVPTKYHDLVHILTPRREHTGPAELQLARYSEVFLDDQFEAGDQGTVFEYELIYQLMSTDNGSPEGNKVPAPDSFVGAPIRPLGPDQEAYRWTWLIKNNQARDDYQRILDLCQLMSLSGAAFQTALPNIIDVDQWLRGSAVNTLSGAGDSYGGDGSAHNVQFYVRPSDQRVLYFPHDMDAFFDPHRPIVPNDDLRRMLEVPAQARAYYGHLLDIIATTYNAAYLGHWADQFGRLLPRQNFAGHLAFIAERARFVGDQVRARVPATSFAIGTHGGQDFGVPTNVVELTGTAPLGIVAFEVNGLPYVPTWTSTTAWRLRVPLQGGSNPLILQGLDYRGGRVADAADTITVTNLASPALLSIVINEWLARNNGPDGLADPVDGDFEDWFELYNPNPTPVDLIGFHLTDDLSQPAKWTFTMVTVLPPRGFLLVWADNEPDQNDASPPGQRHVPFQLDGDGEALGLFSPDGTPQSLITFERQYVNVSQGFQPDGDTRAMTWMPLVSPGGPNQAAPAPQLTLQRLGGGSLILSWNAVPGRSYSVLVSDQLDAPTWISILDGLVADAFTATASIPVGAEPHRFYRVRPDPARGNDR